ncbi:hypothetical protein PCL_08779 [Purpureocillium lilacinum]|uniref:Uncharacterized protein n=2 Tax=Purpureocillium lilacinum TaxID=33203 RepID=A0ACC4DWC4_PURLI|nr:hypothetical protein PCL_08779 [Purpureocillium lilacinum]
MSRRRSLVRKPSTLINLSTLHPEAVDIFRLGQVYLENVDPLFKVTHNPSLQRRFAAAARSLTSNGPSFEALIFSIYCLPTFSLTEEDCLAMFGLTKDDLQTQYQFGSQQALVNAGLLILELAWWCETGLLGRY